MLSASAAAQAAAKTTLVNALAAEFKDKVTLIRHDDYYKRQDSMPPEVRERQNYDCPQAFETELLIEHLKRLKNGESVFLPVYDYKTHNRTAERRFVSPAEVILLDGILILENDELCSLMDIKIFVDTDADIRILRRIERDVSQRGRTLEAVIQQYRDTVKPMHEKYVEPCKYRADIIIPEGGHNKVAYGIIADRIKRHICEQNA